VLRKNQYLLMPHEPNRDNLKIESSNSTSVSGSDDGKGDASGLSASEMNLANNNNNNNNNHDNIMNHNFLMENPNNENIAILNENDENYFELFRTPMKFGTENNSEVTVQIGAAAHLPCTIHSIGEGVVSISPFIITILIVQASKQKQMIYNISCE